MELAEVVPVEMAARTRFKQQRCPDGVRCAGCDGSEVSHVAGAGRGVG
ncbi:MAG: hypothetical protein OXG65_16775 [Chloroflexi bacterium]|nr:hypothetical protein [Chloroflexota bacterium]